MRRRTSTKEIGAMLDVVWVSGRFETESKAQLTAESLKTKLVEA